MTVTVKVQASILAESTLLVAVLVTKVGVPTGTVAGSLTVETLEHCGVGKGTVAPQVPGLFSRVRSVQVSGVTQLSNNTDTVLSPESVVAKSGVPSPLKSALVIPTGPDPTAKVV
ncbi:hypothetical protein SAMN05444487_109117 [Marininema mesophilum]|uniref:Uncharacterized protein n=1 Tax=Marininema mesophilum TaxID=1048340 RepID=A0A1H2YLK4_9BACL|nr:hypothetical protein SAMN05444487_109117 [Marininema mesophilum]